MKKYQCFIKVVVLRIIYIVKVGQKTPAAFISIVLLMMLIMGKTQAFANDMRQNGQENIAEDGDILEPIETVSVGNYGEILVNGKPFFPIMSWYQSSSIYPLLKELGFNTHSGCETPFLVKQYGAYAVPFYYNPESADEVLYKSTISTDHILAWVVDDEPDYPSGSGEKTVPRSPVGQQAARIQHARDNFPDIPVMMTFTGHFTAELSAMQNTYIDETERLNLYTRYIALADIIGFDIYPVYGWGAPSILDWVGSGVSQLCDLAGKKPVYACIETCKGSKWMSYEKQPDVLPEYTRNEVWQAITKGATGINYFTHVWQPTFTEFAPGQAMQDELKRLNKQITRLSAAILAPPTSKNVKMTLEDGLNCNFKATNYAGDLYIFAVNVDLGFNGASVFQQFAKINPRSGTAVFEVEGLVAGTKIDVIDEGRIIVAEDGQFSDEFAALAEHIYRICGVDTGLDRHNSSGLNLNQNYPNPFSSSTSITFNTSKVGHCRLAVYDFVGREVALLIDGVKSEGQHSIVWNGTNSLGQQMVNGVYYYILTTENDIQARKMIKNK